MEDRANLFVEIVMSLSDSDHRTHTQTVTSADELSSYMGLIGGERGGPMAAAQRAALWSASYAYRCVLAVRNHYYDSLALPAWLGIPVFSVGNLTVGGTGKTPMTLHLCQRLVERGRRPAVLSRGYKASAEGLADELLLVSRRCPRAVAIANPNRVAAGELAVEQYGADAGVLDDGFQHRRLARDLDLLLIDATEPFGFGHVLPRGLLREPVQNLRRADVVVITRCDQVPSETLDQIEAAVRAIAPQMPLLHAVHQPAGFADLAGQLMPNPPTGRVGAFAGIARPAAFARTLADLGCTPAATRWWPDHHIYTEADLAALRRWVLESRLDALVTTEKDAVKLTRLDADWPVPVAALRIDLALLADGGKILDEMIDRVLADYDMAPATESDDLGQEP